MLSFEEHQILFHLGEYSSETSSLQYGGLNPDWARPPYSEPLARQPLNPPANPFIVLRQLWLHSGFSREPTSANMLAELSHIWL
jgi:hypothetical protein